MSIETHPSFRWSQRPFEARRGRSPADAQRFVAAMSVRSLPLASAYDPVWAYSHAMGPNPLWLAEMISRAIELKPGMRVLDLGCGTASSSIFLANEFGVSVCAADLWRSPDDNLLSIDDAGSRDLVLPIRCEAHTLPFAKGYFDVIISLDAYHYFGTDEKYLSYCASFLRPGGAIGIICPGNSVDLATCLTISATTSMT